MISKLQCNSKRNGMYFLFMYIFSNIYIYIYIYSWFIYVFYKYIDTCLYMYISYILKLQCLSVCLFVWAVLGRFFQSLPLPYGMFWGVGEGTARWNTGLGGASTGRGGGDGGGGKDRVGGANTGGGGARAGKDRAGGGSIGALCTGFTLVIY